MTIFLKLLPLNFNQLYLYRDNLKFANIKKYYSKNNMSVGKIWKLFFFKKKRTN